MKETKLQLHGTVFYTQSDSFRELVYLVYAGSESKRAFWSFLVSLHFV